MRELSLHIMDIVQNSISADADLIQIIIHEDVEKDILEICIIDNGKGMPEDLLKTVSDPFTTTRTTRKVGLGISLFKAAAEQCNGHFSIESAVGKGTVVKASFQHSHIDRAPLGNIGETILNIVTGNPDVNFVYIHHVDNRQFEFDTRKIKDILQGVLINNAEVILWLKDYLNENIMSLW